MIVKLVFTNVQDEWVWIGDQLGLTWADFINYQVPETESENRRILFLFEVWQEKTAGGKMVGNCGYSLAICPIMD